MFIAMSLISLYGDEQERKAIATAKAQKNIPWYYHGGINCELITQFCGLCGEMFQSFYF